MDKLGIDPPQANALPEPIRAIYSEAKNGKGLGMIAPCNFAAGDIIYSELGFHFPEEDRIRMREQRVDSESFPAFLEDILASMQSIVTKTEEWAHEQSAMPGLAYPVDIRACFFRDVAFDVYSAEEIATGMFDWVKESVKEESRLELLRISLLMIGRFLADSIGCSSPDGWEYSVVALLTGLVNHSCSPNAEIDVLPTDRPAEALITAIANTDIKAGDEITINYNQGAFPSRESFLRSLLHLHNFVCKCDACVVEEHDLVQRDARDSVYQLLFQSAFDYPFGTKLICNMTRWAIDGCEILGLKPKQLGAMIEKCFMDAVQREDHLRACYFLRSRLELIRSWRGSNSDAYIRNKQIFQNFYTSRGVPEAYELSERVQRLDDPDFVDKIFFMKSGAENDFTSDEENLRIQELILQFQIINAKIRGSIMKELLPEYKVDRPALTDQELEIMQAENDASRAKDQQAGRKQAARKNKNKKNKKQNSSAASRSRRVQQRTSDEADAAAESTSETETHTDDPRAPIVPDEDDNDDAGVPVALHGWSTVTHKKSAARARSTMPNKLPAANQNAPRTLKNKPSNTDVSKGKGVAPPIHEPVTHAVDDALKGKEVAAPDAEPALKFAVCRRLLPLERDFPWCKPFTSPLAATDGISKQVWLSTPLCKEQLRFAPRDIEHLVAAKDGYGCKSESFGLRERRDSATGRLEGYKEYLDMDGVFGGLGRSQSFSKKAMESWI